MGSRMRGTETAIRRAEMLPGMREIEAMAKLICRLQIR